MALIYHIVAFRKLDKSIDDLFYVIDFIYPFNTLSRLPVVFRRSPPQRHPLESL